MRAQSGAGGGWGVLGGGIGLDWIFWFLTVCTEVRSDVRVKESGVTPEESVDGWDRGCREI